LTQVNLEPPTVGHKKSGEEDSIHVLHVDDDAGFLKCAKQILEMQGSFEVETAASVEEAQEKMRKKEFDVIVSDYIMPGKDGLEFLKELRDSENSIPFIIFTGKGREIVAIKALNWGADQYINKIGKPEAVYSELAHGISTVVKGKKAEEEFRKSELKYRSLVENAGTGVATTDVEGRFVFVNQALCKMIGYSKEELTGKPFVDFLHPDDKKLIQQIFLESCKNPSRKVSIEFRVIHKKGHIVHMYSSPTATLDNNKIVGFNAILSDVTERKKAEEMLEKERQELNRIVDSSPIIIFYKDKKGKFVRVNKAHAEALKMSEEECLGKTVFDLYSSKIAQSMTKDDLEVLELGRPKLGIIESYESASGIRWVQTDKIPILNENGSPIGLVGFAQDITKRKKAEENLKESEEDYRRIFELAPDAIVALNLKGVITSANHATLRLIGYSADEIVGKHFTKLGTIPNRDITKFVDVFSSVLGGKTPKPFEVIWQSKDGTKHPTEVHLSLMKKDKKTLGIQVVARDITERKRIEDKRKRLLHDLGERMKELQCLFKMAKVVEKPGVSLEEILQGTNSLLPQAWQYPDAACSRIVVENREFKTENFEVTQWKQSSDIKILGKKAGVVEVYYLKEKPMIDEGPFFKEERAVIDAVAERLGRIIERKKVEERLRESEERFRGVFEGATDGILAVNPENQRFVFANPQMCEITGYTLEELLKLGVANLHTNEDLPYVIEQFTKQGEGKFSISNNIPVLRKDQQVVYCDVNSRTINIGEKQYLVGFFRDITERKKAEKALEDAFDELALVNEKLGDATEKWVSLTNNTDDSIMVVDGKGTIEYINRAVPPYKPEEVIGTSVFEYIPRGLHELKRKSLRKVFTDGKTDDYVISSEVPKIGCMWFRTKVIPIKRDGKVVRSIEIVSDITERKRAEEKLQQMMDELMLINEKLEVVGKLTRHDVRNKLSSVTGNIYLAKQVLPPDSESVKYLNETESAVDQIEKIFDFARTYEQLGVEELSYVDVGKSFDAAVALLSDLGKIEVVNECTDLSVLADSLLGTLFYNLIDNTIRHGEKVNRIRIHHKTSKDGLKLIYDDDGVGIPEDEKELIFKEGYGKNTGLGLYMIKKMCNVYGWTIQETGKPGKGAQFTITIPKPNKNGKTAYTLH